ncbi:hypothetical protein MTR67_038395 [Solanum verrucosum]|uniref:HECT-type E3 ubiquitin transferase n=1 Tax=Solanum verrucosum TaxID=315347 RepID=A0AAF0UF48_SOLVR|nr:hypothetical protein MTR67_038395 [Solanum verrucosum]
MMKGNVHDVKHVLRLQDIFPFVHELATRLSHALELSVQLAEFIQLSESDVHEFIQFMHRVKCAIRRQKAFGSPVSFPSLMQDEARNERSEIEGVQHVFCDLLEKSEMCLKELESQLGLVNIERGKLSKKSTDYQWILEHKEVTHLKIRQRFSLKMLLEGRHKNEELYEMLICRSPSKVDPLHLEYFVFSGRIIELALLQRVQISIAFDHVFFLQLAGEDISFEDIRDADPYLKVVELCPNGKNTIVNSQNRDNYVNLLVKHRFVTSIARQIVGSTSAEQRNVLLFFWTSMKSLPVEGFGGLDSKLHIYRTSDSHDCFPSSHTCFYRLCFPPYPSMDVMQNRLNIITQNYVGCSFGAE